MQVLVVTYSLSPYQAELFNQISSSYDMKLEVIYLYRSDYSRSWTPPPVSHPAVYLNQEPDRFEEVRVSLLAADLVVFNYYAERAAQMLLHKRVMGGRPWCFWGERPGFQKPEWLGRLRRRWKLASLHASLVPIWGIGRFAIEGYQREFGRQRTYYNLPYFSDLERFQTIGRDLARDLRCWVSERVFLFSGSLIHRKGVDLLGRAFTRLAREFPHIRLKLIGDGEMRTVLEQTIQPVRNQVEFLGFKDWSELPAYYASADVLCVPSRYDGWGLVVPEGLASGLPVIGTDCMGAAIEFIETGRNGWLVPAGNEDALFAALRAAALLPAEKLAGLSRHARDSVSQHQLQHGAERFIRAARDTVANWQH